MKSTTILSKKNREDSEPLYAVSIVLTDVNFVSFYFTTPINTFKWYGLKINRILIIQNPTIVQKKFPVIQFVDDRGGKESF